jgi:hypothetical protein
VSQGKPRKSQEILPAARKLPWARSSVDRDYSCKGDSTCLQLNLAKKQRKSVHKFVFKRVPYTNWKYLKKLQENVFKSMAHYKFKICKYTAKAEC